MTDERAVSTTLGYTLNIAIAALLVSGLLFAGGSFVSEQRESVLRTEMRVVGQQIASDLERTDRLVRAADTGSSVTVKLTETFPQQLAGSTYSISLDSGGSTGELVLRSTDPEVSVAVSVVTETSLASSTADGGVIVVEYDGSSLVIDNA